MKYFSICILIAITLASSVTVEAGSFGGKRTKTKVAKTYTTPRAKRSVSPATSSSIVKPSAGRSKRGVGGKIMDAATRGFGYGLGREAAKETVKAVKKAAPVVKNKAVELKDKITK